MYSSTSSSHQNRFISDPNLSTFPPPQAVASSTNQQLKHSRYDTITQTATFQTGIKHTGNPPVIRPGSSHKVNPVVIVNGSRTSSFSPDGGSRPMTPNVLEGSRSRSPIGTTTIVGSLPRSGVVGPPIIGAPIPAHLIQRTVPVPVPVIIPSPTQIIRQTTTHVFPNQDIKQPLINQRQIIRLQSANQTLIQNYSNLYSKYKQLQSSQLKQQSRTVQSHSLNQVQLVRSLRSRIQQICDFELQTALSRLHSATPKINIFSKATVMM